MKQETGRRLILITWKEVILHPVEGVRAGVGGWHDRSERIFRYAEQSSCSCSIAWVSGAICCRLKEDIGCNSIQTAWAEHLRFEHFVSACNVWERVVRVNIGQFVYKLLNNLWWGNNNFQYFAKCSFFLAPFCQKNTHQQLSRPWCHERELKSNKKAFGRALWPIKKGECAYFSWIINCVTHFQESPR